MIYKCAIYEMLIVKVATSETCLAFAWDERAAVIKICLEEGAPTLAVEHR